MLSREPERPALIARWIHGDPPAREPVDWFARYGFVVARLLGLVSFVGDVGVLVAPAGLLLATIDMMTVRNVRGVRDRMREREARSWSRWLSPISSATTFGGACVTIIGLIWFAVGLDVIHDAS